METSFVLFNLFQAVPNETNDDDEVSKCHQAFEKEKEWHLLSSLKTFTFEDMSLLTKSSLAICAAQLVIN